MKSFYEVRVIHRELHYRTPPNKKFLPMTKIQITREYLKLLEINKKLRDEKED